MALRPVRSEKREITWSNINQDAGTAEIEITLVTAVSPSSVSTSTEVTEGTSVKWVFFEVNWSANNTTNSKIIHWKVHKIPSGYTGDTNANTYNQNDKKYIFKRGMEMLPAAGSSALTKRIFTVRIPKRYQKFQNGDVLKLSYQCSSTEGINSCGFAIYKSQN